MLDKEPVIYPECPRPFEYYSVESIRALENRRRRARRQQRWAIALCVIGSALLLAWETCGASF